MDDTSLRRSHVLSITVECAEFFLARHDDDDISDEAMEAHVAAAAKAGISLPALLARSVVSYMTECAGRELAAGGGVVSASFDNA
jgi:hypothetical protein